MTGLHDVHLLVLPVRLWAQTQEQTDALLREFALMALGTEMATHEVPHRLLTLMESFEKRFAGVADAQELALHEAASAGVLVIDDLHYQVPAEVTEASIMLGEMLDEADVYCAEGSHLLTLAASPEVVRFRRWFLTQFVDQIAGRPAVPWPDWP